ncbi:MAG: cbb3-type cytochrome oxidase assembly protein CcoS [Bacteroidota bacterium]
MSSIFVLIILGFIVAVAFLAACIWAIRSGQFEDAYTPAMRILFDDKITSTEKTDSQHD